MSSRFSPKSGIAALARSRGRPAAAARAETVAGRVTIAEPGRHQLGDVAAGQLDGVLEQLAGRLGQVGLDVLGVGRRRRGSRPRRSPAGARRRPPGRAGTTSGLAAGAAERQRAASATRSRHGDGPEAVDDRLGVDPADDPRQRRSPRAPTASAIGDHGLDREPGSRPRSTGGPEQRRPASGP